MIGITAGGNLAFALESDDIATLKSVALQTDTVLASTAKVVQSELESGDLVHLRICNMPSIFAEQGITRLRNRTLSPAARKVVAMLEARAEQVNIRSNHENY